MRKKYFIINEKKISLYDNIDNKSILKEKI
jgi:hypothetical protein